MAANFVPVIGGHRAGPRGALTAGHHLVVLRGRQVAKRLDAVFAFIGGDDGIAAQAYEMLEAAFERGGPAGDLAPGQEEEFLRRLLATRLGPGDHPPMAVALLIRREVVIACRSGAQVYWCRGPNVTDAMGVEDDESNRGEIRVARLAVAPRDSILLVGPEVAEHVAPEELEQAATGDSPAKQVASWLVALAVLRSSSPSSALVVQFFSSKTLVAQPGPPITSAAPPEPVARPAAFTPPPTSRPDRPAASTSTRPESRPARPARRPLPPISSMPAKRPSSTPSPTSEPEAPPSEQPPSPPPPRPAPPTVRLPRSPLPRPAPVAPEEKPETPTVAAEAAPAPDTNPVLPAQSAPPAPPVSAQPVSPTETTQPMPTSVVAQPAPPAESAPEPTPSPVPEPEAPPAPAAAITPAPTEPVPTTPIQAPAPPPAQIPASPVPAPSAPTPPPTREPSVVPPPPAPAQLPSQRPAAAASTRTTPVFVSPLFWRVASVTVGVGASAAILFLAAVLIVPAVQHNLPAISAAHSPRKQAAPTAAPTTAPLAPTSAPTSIPTAPSRAAPTQVPAPTAVVGSAPPGTSVPQQTAEHSWSFPPLKASGGKPELALFNPNASAVDTHVRIIRAGHVDARRVHIPANGIVRIPLTAAEVQPTGRQTDTLTVQTTAAIVPMRVVIGQSSGTTG